MNILSDLLVVIIAILGFSFMVFGKPRKNTHVVKDSSGDFFYCKKDNFTKKILKVLMVLVALYFLGSMVK